MSASTESPRTPKHVIDTCVINWLINGTIDPGDLPEGQYVATHIQADEIAQTPDEDRRRRLEARLAETVDVSIPTESFVLGVSRLGEARLSDGLLYTQITDALDAKKLRTSNTQDALIGEVALLNGYTLVTADRVFADVITHLGGQVVFFTPPGK